MSNSRESSTERHDRLVNQAQQLDYKDKLR